MFPRSFGRAGSGPRYGQRAAATSARGLQPGDVLPGARDASRVAAPLRKRQERPPGGEGFRAAARRLEGGRQLVTSAVVPGMADEDALERGDGGDGVAAIVKGGGALPHG